MSYPESVVQIIPALRPLKESVEFKIKWETNEKAKPQKVKVFIILDLVYLKKEILLLDNTSINENKEGWLIVNINDFKLNDIEENKLMNISSINFEFYNENNDIIDTKTVILQILKEKGEVFKNIL